VSITTSQNKEALQLLISTFRSKAKEKIEQSGRGIFTGKLIDSITGDIEYSNGEYVVSISMEEYGTYIDEGVNGTGFEKTKSGKADRRFKSNRNIVRDSKYSFKDKMPPISAIKPWASAKGLNPWAVQRSIFQKGIKGIHFFEEVLNYEAERLADYIAEAEANNLLNQFGED
jgi:hypothetical protein